MTKDKVIHELATTKNLVRWDMDDLSLQNVDFSKANIEHARLGACKLSGASFAGANLHSATFTACRLNGAVFAGAELQAATFVRCNGLSAETIAMLEKEGAVVSQPAGRLSSFLGIAAVVVIAAALFLLSGGYSLLNPNAPPESTSPVAPADATPQMTTDQRIQAAQASYAAKDFTATADLLAPVAAGENASPETLAMFATACLQAGRLPDAAKAAERLIAEAPGQDEKLHGKILLASALLRGTSKAEGRKLSETLLEENTHNIRNQRAVLMNLGTDLWQTQDFPGAQQAFEKLLRISEPDQKGGVWLNIALVHRDAGNVKAEAAAYRTAYSDAKASKDVRLGARLGLAGIEIRSGNVTQARRQIIDALAAGADPGQVLNAARSIVAELKKKGDHDEAIALLTQLTGAFEGSTAALNDARVDLANLLIDQEKTGSALALYRQVAMESPNPTQKNWAAETVAEIESNLPPDEATPDAEAGAGNSGN
jgi:tetratricopeptide (TPR) repeat protein